MPEIDVEHKNISISVNRGESFSIIHPKNTVDVSHDVKRISVDRTDKTVRVSREDTTVQVTHPELTVSLYNGGTRGVPGAKGDAATIEVGSTTTGLPDTEAEVTNVGTVNAAILDFVIPKGEKGDQGEPGADGDKNYTTTFSPTDTLLVTHNLNKYPSVDVINSAGDEVIGDVNYLTTNSLIVSFSAAFGGRITCN